MTACFETGNDLTVWADGALLGGVMELSRTVKRNGSEIREFLTDVPVAVMPQERYYITLKLLRPADFPFDGGIAQLSVKGSGRVETYSQCTAERIDSTVTPRGETVYTVVIAAQERSVADE